MLCNWKRILIHTSFFSAKMVWVYLVNKSRNGGNCVHVIFFFSVLCEHSDSIPECKLLTGKPCNDTVLGVCGLCLLHSNPMDCSPPGSPYPGISQARILERGAISFSRDLPDPGIEFASPVWQADSLPLSHLGSL